VKRVARNLAVCFSLGVVSGQAAFAQPIDADARTKETTVLRLARSPDGLRFTPVPQVFLRNASSPDLERLEDGTLLAVFDYRSDGDTEETRIGAATSKDDGRSWSPVKRIKITDRTGSPVHARHADVLPLSDGRVRLYFTDDAPKTRRAADEKPTAACVIRSAIARDGGRYRVEPEMGLRFHDLPDAIAAVVGFKSHTHLYVSPGVLTRANKDDKADNSVRHAIARDGRRFARVAPIDVEDGVSIGSIVSLDDGLRAYGTSEKGIRSMVSDDGAKWKLEPGVRLPRASDPAVTRLKDGSFLMLFVSPADRETTEAVPLVAVSVPSDDASLPASDEETPGGEAGETADSESTDGAENAATEVDALGFAPMPDFQADVDYVHWYGEQALEKPEDNAYDAYAEFMPGPNDQPGDKPDWPIFKDMFNDGTYEGPPGPWGPAEHPDWVQSNREIQNLLDKFRDATKRPGYACRQALGPEEMGPQEEGERLLINLLLPYLGPHRTLARATLANAWRTENGKVSQDRMNEAWKTVLRGAAQLGQGATLIESLVGIAENNQVEQTARWALKHNVFDETGLETALQTLRQFDQDVEDPVRWVRGEHASSLDITQYLFSPPDADGQPSINLERVERILRKFGEDGDWDVTIDDFTHLGPDDARAAIDAFNAHYREIAEQMRIGYPDVRSRDIEATEAGYLNASPLTKMLLPSLSRYHKLRTRTEASRRATQLAYATHLYRARNGRWPKSLDELPANMGDTMRTDPFTGRQFGYRVTDEGPTIYSLSENGVDDGGVHSPRWDDKVENDAGSDDYVFWPPQP